MGYQFDRLKKGVVLIRERKRTSPVFEQSLLNLGLNGEHYSVNDNSIWLQLFGFDMVNHQLQRLVATKLVDIQLKCEIHRFH